MVYKFTCAYSIASWFIVSFYTFTCKEKLIFLSNLFVEYANFKCKDSKNGNNSILR